MARGLGRKGEKGEKGKGERGKRERGFRGWDGGNVAATTCRAFVFLKNAVQTHFR